MSEDNKWDEQKKKKKKKHCCSYSLMLEVVHERCHNKVQSLARVFCCRAYIINSTDVPGSVVYTWYVVPGMIRRS